MARRKAHDDHGGMRGSQPHKPTPQENELVQTVRAATEQFKDVTNVAGPGPELRAHVRLRQRGRFRGNGTALPEGLDSP